MITRIPPLTVSFPGSFSLATLNGSSGGVGVLLGRPSVSARLPALNFIDRVFQWPLEYYYNGEDRRQLQFGTSRDLIKMNSKHGARPVALPVRFVRVAERFGRQRGRARESRRCDRPQRERGET